LAYGWNVLLVSDANDTGRIENALDVFRNTKGRPMIILDSHIEYGVPHKQDTAAARGEPLGEEEIRLRAFPELAAEIDQMERREFPAVWGRNLLVFRADPKGIAGRDVSSKLLNVIAQNIPWFLGGSADLGASNRTLLTYEGLASSKPIRRPERTCTMASASTPWRRS
jgi:transketolase